MITKKLDRTSKISLHSQLYKVIKENIKNGTLKEGNYLPSELELQKLFDVSRITVRRALADLESENYIDRTPGVGTRVLPRLKPRDITKLSSFTEEAIALGEEPTSVVLDHGTKEADEFLAEVMNIKVGTKIWYLKRLLLINNQIIGVSISNINHPKMSFESNEFNSNVSLYKLMETKGINIVSAEETIQAMNPTVEVKRELYLDDKTPVIYRNRIGFDGDNIIAEYTDSYFNAEKYTYKINLTRDI